MGLPEDWALEARCFFSLHSCKGKCSGFSMGELLEITMLNISYALNSSEDKHVPPLRMMSLARTL